MTETDVKEAATVDEGNQWAVSDEITPENPLRVMVAGVGSFFLRGERRARPLGEGV